MEDINNLDEACFSAMGGWDVTVILRIKKRKVLFNPVWLFAGQDDVITLHEIRKQVQKKYGMCGTILVLAESYLHGEIYRYGNHGEFWEKKGETDGCA